jgi:hypothetical protein
LVQWKMYYKMARVIDRNNYQEFFLDYYESNLNEKEREDMFAFLKINADLKQEFDSFQKVTAPAPGKVYFDKDRLKKNTVTTYNYKTYFIALLENDLNDSERVEVEKFLVNNPSLKSELELFRQAKIPAEKKVLFPGRDALKKSGRVIPFNVRAYRITAVAASIALFIVFVYQFNRSSNVSRVVDVPKNSEIRTLSNPSVVEKGKQMITQHSPGDIKIALVKKIEKQVKDVYAHNNASAEKQPIASGADAPSAIDSSFLLAVNEPVEQDLDSIRNKYQPFSDEELAELRENNKEKTSIQSADSNSTTALNKLFGDNIKIQNKRNDKDSSSTFALAIGKFEFSRTVSR